MGGNGLPYQEALLGMLCKIKQGRQEAELWSQVSGLFHFLDPKSFHRYRAYTEGPVGGASRNRPAYRKVTVVHIWIPLQATPWAYNEIGRSCALTQFLPGPAVPKLHPSVARSFEVGCSCPHFTGTRREAPRPKAGTKVHACSRRESPQPWEGVSRLWRFV